MPLLLNLDGCRFDRLQVIARKSSDKFGHARWLCKCDCGNEIITTGDRLTRGHTKSCGCLQKEQVSHRFSTHKQSGTRLHSVWKNMVQRCTNINNSEFQNYKGRGISICESWLSFEAFMAWSTTNGYQDDLQIDRIDNNLGYSPGNCRWATAVQQANNKRNNHIVCGETLAQQCRKYGIKSSTVRMRIKKGWPDLTALITPPGVKYAINPPQATGI